jgi:DNA-binding HxlR family transcriptional regulator
MARVTRITPVLAATRAALRSTSLGKVSPMAHDECCPVCRTADIVCGKWTLLLVRELAAGRSRFSELERSLVGISPRTLSLRLRALEDEDLVARCTHAEVPPRVEYVLTEKGRALLPIIDSMRDYGERWIVGRIDGPRLDALAAATAALPPEPVAA